MVVELWTVARVAARLCSQDAPRPQYAASPLLPALAAGSAHSEVCRWSRLPQGLKPTPSPRDRYR